MNPFVAFVRSVFDCLLMCFQFSMIMVLISGLLVLLADFVKSKLFKHPEDDKSGIKPIIIMTLIQMAILVLLTFNSIYSTYTSSSYASHKIVDRYEERYPRTLAYIENYAADPYEYIEFYDKVWGDLQRYNGDGIVFDTLSSYEQSLVNYPDVGKYIYYTSGSNTYHSTPMCYSLLRSEVLSRLAKYSYLYSPCSKCVGD